MSAEQQDIHWNCQQWRHCFEYAFEKWCWSGWLLKILWCTIGDCMAVTFELACKITCMNIWSPWWNTYSALNPWRAEKQSSSNDLLVRWNIFMSLVRCPAAKDTLTAVSSLSPVSTHTLIPACRRDSIVSATPSCSRSSTAVAPSKHRFASMKSYAVASFKK